MMKLRKVSFALVALALALVGCTIVDGSGVLTGIKRSPITAEKVRLYRAPPAKFEEIGIVFASAGHDFRSNSGIMQTAVDRLKEEAAKLGANGVLLTELKERDAARTVVGLGTSSTTGVAGSTVISTHSTGTLVGIDRGDAHTRLRGIAIHVSAD
jgi:hypothetical protein